VSLTISYNKAVALSSAVLWCSWTCTRSDCFVSSNVRSGLPWDCRFPLSRRSHQAQMSKFTC